MFGALDTSASALVAQRVRLETVAANMANMNSIYDADGNVNPYRRRFTVFAPGDPATGSDRGVHVREIALDQSDFRMRYEPGHPAANAEGYVAYPNVDSTIETINAIEAYRAYEANVTAAEATKQLIQSSLRLLA
jgi:flagellar basal-body rod protein FlgC